jgi:hypothetical protein
MTEFMFYHSQIVLQRLHIGVHFFFYITGKKTKITVCKRDYWPRKKYLFVSFMLGKSCCKCKKSLSRSGLACKRYQLDIGVG